MKTWMTWKTQENVTRNVRRMSKHSRQSLDTWRMQKSLRHPMRFLQIRLHVPLSSVFFSRRLLWKGLLVFTYEEGHGRWSGLRGRHTTMAFRFYRPGTILGRLRPSRRRNCVCGSGRPRRLPLTFSFDKSLAAGRCLPAGAGWEEEVEVRSCWNPEG